MQHAFAFLNAKSRDLHINGVS
eukprot:COSAG02_NODE_51502_length_313_cov_1.691589_1_plen_21_part_10